MELITIIVSTVDGNITNNKSLLEINLHKDLRMIIVNQMINRLSPIVIPKDYCKVINEKNKGLSLSRNRALAEINSGIVVIADDDVTYVDNFEELIRNSYRLNPNCDVLTFQIRTPEGPMYKIYPPKSYYHNKFTVLKVSSISIVLKISSINTSGCRFDINFGLGTKFGSGEENIFLTDLLKKGLIIKYIPEVLVIHPFESSGKILNEQQLFNKGILFKRLFGIIGLPILIIFIFKKKKEIQNYSILKSIIISLKGYFKKH